MIKGLSRAGIGDAGDLTAFIQKAAAHGFGAVDAGGQEIEVMIEQKGGVQAAKDYLAEHRIVISSIGLSVEWRKSEEEFLAGLPQLAADAKAAASVDCRSCCTYVLPSTDWNAAHFMAVATRRLRTCAQLLGAYGIRLGLEFVGPHHLRTTWKNPFIWDMGDTLDWIHAIGEPNVGLLLDAYHWYTTEAEKEDLLKLTPNDIVHVHINDAKNVPVQEALDNDRVYPGEGVIDLKAFLDALRQIGYEGAVAQEILTREPSAESSDELFARSQSGFQKVFG